MSGWYKKMYKTHQVARERNKREQRRLDSDRHGPSFVAKYQLSNLDHERRMVERELEKIRRGIHKHPSFSKINKTNGSDVITNNQSSDTFLSGSSRKVETGNSKVENDLYDAMIYLQNNPSALVPLVSAYGQSDAYLETLGKVVPSLQNSEDSQPYTPKYLRERDRMEKSEKTIMLEKYKFLLQRNSPEYRQNSPFTSRRQVGYTHARGSGNGSKASNDGDTDRGSSSYRSQSRDGKGHLHAEGISNNTPEPTSSRTRRDLDLHDLASGGMDNARDNVNRRLARKDSDSSEKLKLATEAGKLSDDGVAKATKAATLFPTLDPEYYNADGTLRTQHAMPDFKDRWEEAKKTRYVRTREPRPEDTELSLEQIFAKK